MSGIYAATVLFMLYAFGEFVATKTKGLLSSVFVICVVMLFAFWGGMPHNIVSISGISQIGSTLVGLLVVGIGTTIDFEELKNQWKTVVVSLLGVTAGVIGIVAMGNYLIGWNESVASAPIFAGASVALIIVNNALTDLKLIDSLGVIIITIFATQKFFGVPLASFCLQKEAISFLKDKEKIDYYAAMDEGAAKAKKASTRPLARFSKNDKPAITMAKLAAMTALSFYLGNLTGGTVHYLVIALLIGVLFTELGFLSQNSLSKTQSDFLLTFALIMTVFSSLARVTPASLVANLIPTVIVMIIGCMGVILAGFISSKIFNMGAGLCIALGITCTFGFPTTMLVSYEIADSMGKNDQERKALRNYIFPKMIIAGFVTVTIASVVLAGALITLLK